MYGDLISYGIFKQNFYVILKVYNQYELYVMMAIPDCDFCNEPGIREHIEEFVEDDCTYRKIFDDLKSAFEGLSRT